MSDTEIIISMLTIAAFGIGAQWIGRRLGFPSLLLLLPAGLIAGDVLQLVEPKELLGDALFPFVTLLVSLLLFQSGLQLRFADLPREARRPVVRLITIGLIITFVGGSLSALAVLDVGVGLSFLLGAIIVVSGPTVVGPLLASVRVREPTGSVLAYEGTFLDPLGATLGVVVLNLVLAAHRGGVHPALQLFGRLGLGVAVGAIAAALLVLVMYRFLLTDDMEAAVAVLFAVVAFSIADALLSEAGLFATLTLGVILANQNVVGFRRVFGFGETLEVIIIGALFILLGALVTIEGLGQHWWRICLLVLALVLVVRPLAAAVSTIGSTLSWRDRAFIGWLDPRGIVAASTAATFTGSLADTRLDASFLLPVVFGVILGTGLVYGLTARPVARRLGVALPPPQGVGLVGKSGWVVDFARQLHELGVRVVVMLTESVDVANAETKRSGVQVLSVSDTRASSRDVIREADVAVVAMCTTGGIAADLLEAGLVEAVGRRHVLRCPETASTPTGQRLARTPALHAFTPNVFLTDIESLVERGAVIDVVEPGAAKHALVLAAVSPTGMVNMRPGTVAPQADDRLVALVAGPRPQPDKDDRNAPSPPAAPH